jgi:uncharacterized protein YbgA (DUF1722 family)/uncharacterized protein YbbK (DUF523 family)
MPHVDFVPVCAEVEIGLGTPREPIRIVQGEQGPLLYQPASDTYWTEQMEEYAAAFLDAVGELDGAVLKSRSPSCGIKDVKVYPASPKGMPTKTGVGVFASAVLERFPECAVEDEGRLTNFQIREHFMTRVFVSAAYRGVRGDASMHALTQFQARAKYLLMAYSERSLRELGRIAANHDHRTPAEVYAAYGAELLRAFARPARRTATINVLQHMFGFFSEGLSGAEKAYFADCLEDYRALRVPMSVPVGVLRSWVVRFDQQYLRDQMLFEPYPQELVQVTDSGKGRDLS